MGAAMVELSFRDSRVQGDDVHIMTIFYERFTIRNVPLLVRRSIGLARLYKCVSHTISSCWDLVVSVARRTFSHASRFLGQHDISHPQPGPSLLVLDRLLVPLSPLFQKLPLQRAFGMLQHRQVALDQVVGQDRSFALQSCTSSSRMLLVLFRLGRSQDVFPRTDLHYSVQAEQGSGWWRSLEVGYGEDVFGMEEVGPGM